MSQKSTRDVFLDSVCTQLFAIQLVFLISVLFLLFSIVGVLFLDPDTPEFVLSVVNSVTLGVFVAVFGSLTYLCNNRSL